MSSGTMNIQGSYNSSISLSAQEFNLTAYTHTVKSRVRSYDVDRQSIVHNAVYLYWLEAARIEYFRTIGLPMDFQTFVTKHRFVVAHVEVDYFYAAQFDEEYEILTRVPYVKNSSFGFDQVIRLTNGKILLRAKAVMVHLNPASNKPERIADAYRKLIREYEGNNVEISE
ncbi:MAG: acyl-CoA thioesterase [Bacteroidetes bacterium]|nr:acyl-CoA thioesterase [Bacteroidota bacterium]